MALLCAGRHLAGEPAVRGHGDFEGDEDGSATLTTEYSNLEALSQAVLLMVGRCSRWSRTSWWRWCSPTSSGWWRCTRRADPGQPAAARGRAAVDDAPGVLSRTQGPVAPERFALLQALLAFLLERCGDESSATVSSADMRDRFHLSQQELQEHLDLLNLVNFGGGCYAVYCSTQNGSILVDKELYGDTFRRPARLSPLEAKALLRALDVVAPVWRPRPTRRCNGARKDAARSAGTPSPTHRRRRSRLRSRR